MSQVPILIVDDDAGKRLSLIAILSRLGHTIVEADSGEAALRRLIAQDFAVILLDVRMPVMDGFETAALIRLRKQSEMTPIIFITAYSQDELAGADRYAEGAVDFICGPVQPEELRAKVSVFANLFLRAQDLAAQAREVEQSAGMLRALTDAAPIGIFRTDADCRYVYVNPRYSELTGIPAEEALGREYGTIHDAGQRGSLSEPLERRGAAPEISNRFEIQPSGGGEPRVVHVTAKRMRDVGGAVVGWVGTLSDVTFEAGAELAMADARDQATEASRMKSDFLANMSHEIRTPMNGVIGMTDLLLETDLDARQRDYATTVRNSGEALLTIIDDILDFSKVEAGKLEIEEVGFDVRDVVEEVVTLLAGAAQAKGLELVASIDSAVPVTVTGDPGRVRQVLTNLLGNAIKFTGSGEIVARASLVETTGADVVLRFEVADTGDGIAEDKLATIFEPFVQADTSTSRKYGGTGLGLAISGQLVALMGGACGVSSRLGVGSEFWFTIRVGADPGQATQRAMEVDAGLSGVSALIVDASSAQRKVLSEHMTDWGMAVTEAASGRAALATLRTASLHGRPFAVAVVDQRLSDSGGAALSDVIAGDPALDVHVVTMAGLGQASESSLSKPVHRSDLKSCLRVAVGLETAKAEAGAAAGEGSGSPEATPVAGRLLLAEDNLINQKVAVAMLSSAGYAVDTALNGTEAVRSATSRHYDAILMDCQMPELNGYEATAGIRAHEGSRRHTPIIAMTAGARAEDRERCLSAGMDDYLAKPVSKDALLELVARWVRTQRS